MVKSALVLLAPGFEEIEAITIIDLLRRAGINVTSASTADKKVTGSHKIPVIADKLLNQVSHIDYDVILLPGGPGVANLTSSKEVNKLVVKQAKSNRLLGAICAAPNVLNNAGLLKKKTITSYPSEEKKFTDSEYVFENVVVDGKIVTSRAVGTALDFSLKVIEILAGKNKAQEVAEKILYPY